MASLFVRPLIESERRCGFRSRGICAGGETDEYFEVLEGACIRSDNVLQAALGVQRLWRLFKKEEPDIVICHNSISVLIPLLVAYFSGIKSRVYFNHGVPFLGYRGFKRVCFWMLEYWNLKVSTHVITVSKSMKSTLLQLPRTEVLSVDMLGPGSCCGVTIGRNDAELDAETERLRKNFNIKQTDVVFLFVGRPTARKGLKFCLKLWSQKRLGDRAKLVLCGPNLGDVLSLNGDCPQNVLPIGFQVQMDPWYRLSDAVILPSLHEGLPYAVLEGFCHGKPAIVNSVPGLVDLVTDTALGWPLAIDDVSQFTDTISSIVSDRSTAQMKSGACIERAKEFSRDRIIKIYIDKLQSYRR